MTEERRSNAELHEVIEGVRELKRNHREMLHDVRCLKDSMETYKPFLDDLMAQDGAWQRLKSAIIERSATGIVWGIVLLVGLSIWEFIIKRIAH